MTSQLPSNAKNKLSNDNTKLSYDNEEFSLRKKYWQVIKQAWSERDLVKTLRNRSEMEFLPAVLEIQETPPHPLPRLLLWVISSLIFIALVWSIFGKIDIVATAQGKVIPSEFVKYVQSVNTATVNKILVQDGQFVESGKVLVQLDSTITEADLTKLKNDYVQSRLDSIRQQNLLNKLANQPLVAWSNESIFTPELLQNSKNQFDSQWLEFQNKLSSIDATQHHYDESIRTSQSIITKYKQTLPIMREKEADYKELYDKNFMSQHGYLDISKQRIELQQSLAEEQGKVREIQAQKQESQRQKELTIAEFRRDIGEKLLITNQNLVTNHEEYVKAQQNQDYTQLVAPVSGYVTQLAVHTVGGVVTPAQPLLAIVPKDGGIMIQTQLENKDIGFVHPNQEVKVKIEAFPFTRYGTIDGIVQSVSADAIQDTDKQKKDQLLYNVYIKLGKDYMIINETKQYLTPGMMVTAEIKTGKRPLIDYFLSPLVQNTTEALHER